MSELNYEPYKLPLKAVEGGHGFWGAVGRDSNGLLQCHECGGLFAQLGIHAAQKHGLKAVEYRQKYKLTAQTLLASETVRSTLIAAAAAVSPELREKRLEALRKGREAHPRKQTWFGKTLEQKNREGICPDQLIDKIQLLAGELGHTPSLREFRTHYHGLQRIIFVTFGSWRNAVAIAGLEEAAVGRAPQYNRRILIDMLQSFETTYKRQPETADIRNNYIPSQYTFTKYFGGFVAAKKEAFGKTTPMRKKEAAGVAV